MSEENGRGPTWKWVATGVITILAAVVTYLFNSYIGSFNSKIAKLEHEIQHNRRLIYHHKRIQDQKIDRIGYKVYKDKYFEIKSNAEVKMSAPPPRRR